MSAVCCNTSVHMHCTYESGGANNNSKYQKHAKYNNICVQYTCYMDHLMIICTLYTSGYIFSTICTVHIYIHIYVHTAHTAYSVHV
jgi:hypothetical protein